MEWQESIETISLSHLLGWRKCSFSFFHKMALFSCYSVSKMGLTLRLHERKHARLPCPSLSPRICSNSCPLSQWCHPAISSSAVPFSSWPQSFPASGSFQWVSSSHHVAKVLELQHRSLQWIFRVDFLSDWLIWSPCCPRHSQESSAAPQFKSIDSSVLSLVHGPTLTGLLEKP